MIYIYIYELAVLGTCLDSTGGSSCSVRYRLAAATRHWHARRTQLCCRKAPLKMRISRFYGTVVRTLLYGAGGWTPSAQTSRLLRAFELRCLRSILGRKRRHLETYMDWARRSNALLRRLLASMGQPSVVELQLRAYHGWAGHAARVPDTLDLPFVLRWRTVGWWQALQIAGPSADDHQTGWRHGRPGRHTRWEDMLAEILHVGWMGAATNRCESAKLAWPFVAQVLIKLEGASSGKFSWKVSRELDSIQREAVLVYPGAVAGPQLESQLSWYRVATNQNADARCLACCVDSDLVVSWMNGVASVDNPVCKPYVRTLQDKLAQLQLSGSISTWTDLSPFAFHIPRACNTFADALANDALDTNSGRIQWNTRVDEIRNQARAFVLHSDGAARGNPGPSACGAAVSAYVDSAWLLVVSGSRLLQPGTNNVAELQGLNFAADLLESFLIGHLLLD